MKLHFPLFAAKKIYKYKVLFYCIVSLGIGLSEKSFSQTNNPPTFTLEKICTTSAGVFKNDSILIRILWVNVKYNAGTYPIYWDGKDDNGNIMAPNHYKVKVLINNFIYTWEGAYIGNTSTAKFGNSKHHVYGGLSDIAITNGKATYASGYSERLPSVFSFSTSAIQTKLDVFDVGSSLPFTTRVTTDGINNYYTGYNSYTTSGNYQSFIYGSKCSNNSQVTFSSGISYTMAPFGDIYSVAGYLATPTGTVDNYITSLTVCAASNLLYFVRPALNTIYCINKTTGASIATITSFTTPKSVAFDNSGNLWVASGTNTIAKYTVNTSTGTLTATGVTITGVTSPGKMLIDPTGSIIGVLDLGTGQLKTFNNNTGTAGSLVIGSTNSYNSNSSVADNKFSLTALIDVNAPSNKYGSGGFCFDSNGSVWITDIGNNRFQHFSNTGTYLESLQITHTPYGTRVDLADKTRVFCNLSEYSIDYSQPLSGSTGWALTRNWGPQIIAVTYTNGSGQQVPKYETSGSFSSVRTFNNGAINRTFAFLIRKDYVRGYELVELQPSGAIRFTGVIKDSPLMDADGALFLGDGNMGGDGGAYAFNKHAFTGAFDGSDNPIWSSTTDVVFDTSGMTGDDAQIAQSIIVQSNNYITSDNRVVLFNNSTASSTNKHVGFGNKYGTSFYARASKSTYTGYGGTFPGPEWYDIGNQVNNNSNACVNVLGKIAITNLHHESWKLAQTNKYNVYYSNGLPLGQFGTTRFDSPGEAQPMMEGNALTPQLIAGVNADEAYLYHGGEGDHSAVHRWKITGLMSIQELNPVIVTIPDSSLVAPKLPGINLMEGLISGTLLNRGVYGWTGDAEQIGATTFNAKVGVMNPNKTTPDLTVVYSSTLTPKSISRALQILPTALNAWSLNGNISFCGSFPNNNVFGGGCLEILDHAGKIICQFYTLRANTEPSTLLIGNGKTLVSNVTANISALFNNLQPFSVSRSGNNLTFSYAGYTQTITLTTETGADISKPSSMRLNFFNGTVSTGHAIIVDNLRFVSKKFQLINFTNNSQKYIVAKPFVLNATSTSNLPISYTVISGSAKVLGNVITFTGTGVKADTVIIQATQPGNDEYDAASPVLQTFTVNPIRVDL